MIEQCRFSECVKFFKDGFKELWDLSDYHDINKPCYFVGVYNAEDVKEINRHKGLCVVSHPSYIRDIFYDLKKDIVYKQSINTPEKLFEKYKTKRVNVPIKDYTVFKPSVLGEGIYWYMGNNSVRDYYGFELYEKIRKNIKHRIIIGLQGNEINYVEKEYYDKCFINIKPNIYAGGCSSVEMGKKGRFSISKNIGNAHLDIDEIFIHIEKESNRIGTMPVDLLPEINNNPDWKNINTWII
jgi:hypothetical protein